jgi:pSer/pThr/pTyr-binding forkhead associated (FHA) protein
LAKEGETRGQPPPPAEGGKPKRFWLEHNGQNIDLRRGRLLVGRSSNCQLILEDSMVSRRHAELLVTEDSVTVVDLGSVNGLYLNSRRVRENQRMKEGDRLQIGQREFVLQSVVRASMPSSSDRANANANANAQTLHGDFAALMNARAESEDQTHVGDVFDVLGSVADKVLALDRGDEAERILSGVLISMQREAAAGKDLNPAISERAATYAVRIASATGRASWLDYTIDLYAKLGRVLPLAVVDQLYDVVRKARGMNVTALRAYVASVEGKELGPSERFVLQRLQGLERVVLS